MFYRICRFAMCKPIALAVMPAALLSTTLVWATEPPSLDEIRASLDKQRQQVKSLYIEVKGYATNLVDPKVLASWSKFSRSYEGVDEMDHFAFKGTNRYARQMLPPEAKRLSPERPPQVDPKASPEDQEIQEWYVESYQRRQKEDAKWARMGVKRPKGDPNIARFCPDDARADDGKTTWERRFVKAGLWDVFINRHDPKLEWVQNPWYLSSIGWDCNTEAYTKDEDALSRARNNLVNALRRGEYTPSRDLADLDGAKCVVLEREVRPEGPRAKFMMAGTSRVWLDIDHGFAVRQFEMQQRNGDLSRTVNSDLVEILPGVWFPKKSQWQQFAPPDAPKEYQGRPVRIWHSELTKWIVNDVPNELFEVPIKPGDRVHDTRLTTHP